MQIGTAFERSASPAKTAEAFARIVKEEGRKKLR